ncbi:hypothetical protein [Streptomyces sp. NPDC002889]
MTLLEGLIRSAGSWIVPAQERFQITRGLRIGLVGHPFDQGS